MRLPVVFAGQRRLWLLRLALNGSLQAAAGLTLSMILSRAVDGIAATANPSSINVATDMVLASALCMLIALLRWLERADAERVAQNYVFRVRQRILRVMWALPSADLARSGHGGLVLRFVGDMSAIGQWVGRGIAKLTSASLLLAGVMAGLAWRDWRLAVLGAAILLAAGGIAALTGPALMQAVRELRHRRSRLAALLTEHLAAHASIRQSGGASRALRQSERASRRVRESAVRAARRSGLFEAGVELLALFLPLAALSIIALYRTAGGGTLGDAVAIIALCTLLATPLRELARVFEYAQRAALARAKIGAFLAHRRPLRIAPASGPTSAGIAVELRGVSCAPALAGASMTIAAGAHVCIRGATGSGRTTLLQLLLGQRTPESGAVLLAGAPIGGALPDCGWINPGQPLLRGRVARNLPAGARAAAIPQVESLICSLPRGWDTRIDDASSNLSAGERLRIIVARTIAMQPQLILVDDAASLTDAPARQALREFLTGSAATVVAVDGEADLLGRVDAVWLLAGGRLSRVPAAPTPVHTLREAAP
jgi:ABC-type multidrug transport system fused ATPase/permease subunit